MYKHPIILIASALFMALVMAWPVTAHQGEHHLKVTVVAPSASAAAEARSIRYRLGWVEVPLAEADAVLVVVRSNHKDPLGNSYHSIESLQNDADGLLNRSGDLFHLYLFEIHKDRNLVQWKHTSYKTDK